MNIPRLTLVFLLVALATSVQAETVNCTPITSLPATITSSGVYCLTGNLGTPQTSGDAITISANFVTLDLNGWKLDGHKAGTGTAAGGILSNADNVTIKNGFVRGFSIGIILNGSGAMVQNITADQNTYAGIVVGGTGSIVQDNQVVNTGGETAVANDNATGIAVNGSESLVQNNLVSGLTPVGTGAAVGIYIGSSASKSTALANTVSESELPTSGFSYGVWAYNAAAVAVSSNIVTNFNVGVQYSSATGTYSRNMALSCTTSYSGGTAGSGND